MGEIKNNAAEGDKPIIDKQTSEREFERYCEANDIDFDTAAMDEDEKKDFEKIKKRFVKVSMQGRVHVDGTDLKYIVSKFSPSGFSGREITIKRSGGQSYMGMDNYKDTQTVHKMNGFLSAMTGQEVSFFAKIDGSDWAFFRDIATLFLVD